MLLVFLPATAHGTFKRSLFLTLQNDYNDNIFLTSGNKEEDFITRQSLGFLLSKNMPRYDLALDYEFEAKIYSRFKDANNETHTVNAKSHMELMKNVFYLDVEENFTKIPIDIRRPVLTDEVDVNLLNVNSVKLSAYIAADISPRTFLRAGYTFLDTEYSGSEASDTNYNIVFESLERRLSPKFIATIDYEFKQKLADNLTRDFELHKLALSASYRLSNAITFKANAGNGWFVFEGSDNDEHPFWSVDLERSFDESEGMTIHYGREFADSPQSGLFKSEQAYLSFYYGRKLKVNGKVLIQNNDFITVDRRDTKNRADLGFSWQVANKLNLSANGYAAGEDYSPLGESVLTWGTEFKVSYKLRRIATLEARYRHTDRDSNIETNSFVNNIYTLMLRAKL